MGKHATIPGLFGPGTYVDTEFHGVPAESRRILSYLVSVTPGIGITDDDLAAVEFAGQDLPIIPGPLKSQVMVRVDRRIVSRKPLLSRCLTQ